MKKLRLLISWMLTRMKDSTFELYAEHLLALTQKQYNNFSQEDMIRMTSVPRLPPPCPTTPMTTFTGHTKGTTSSESQIALNNFKKGTKRDASAFPIFKNDAYMIVSRDLSGKPTKHTDSMMLLIQILILMVVINMTSNSFWRNNLLCILCWLLLFIQTKGSLLAISWYAYHMHHVVCTFSLNFLPFLATQNNMCIFSISDRIITYVTIIIITPSNIHENDMWCCGLHGALP